MPTLAFDSSDPFLRRRRRSRRSIAKHNRRILVRLLAFFSVVPAALALTLLIPKPEPARSAVDAATDSHDEALVAQAQPEPATPVVYRYSVVPGGVDSVDAVTDAIERDAVVAAHYAALDVDKLAVQTLTEPMTAHVSYRIGDTVFWTAKKLTLNAGEQVLSDGTHMVRARCGNRIEMAALLPAFSAEPGPDEFDNLVAAALLPREDDPALGGIGGAQTRSLQDPIPAPEPGTIILLGAGLAAGLAKRRRQRIQQRGTSTFQWSVKIRLFRRTG